ncbi:MAG: aminotransferase class I/II-fold pyridoxal phosphate-dependent enzyme [Eubacteriaceae bacterium]|nr:aminotransferase class I/II-fold pyridoxal phosphate-dependent enzyme [Eubacteriaceae bacterium]
MQKNVHGGDIISAESVYGGRVLDFSVNINPLGIPQSVRNAAANADYMLYPDPLCRELSAGIAQKDGVEKGYVLCGNGAADIIYRIAYAQAPKTALLTAPTFSDYEESLAVSGCSISYHLLAEEECFDLGESYLKSLESGYDIAYLCNPNNPTGRLIDANLLEKIIIAAKDTGTRLVVDECFLELSTQEQGLEGFLAGNPHLLLLRAFTKSMAVAGLRIGYCLCSDSEFMDKLVRCAQAWSVSEPAQAAGLAALGEGAHVKAAKSLLSAERPWLLSELSALGLKVFEPSANFILFKANGVADLKERMLRHGILIRSCSNYNNLGDEFYRVAIKAHNENEQLIAALKLALPSNA